MKEANWPAMSPISEASILSTERATDWRRFDSSVNAVSFGFVATAILISMFLVMAVFERFLRSNSMPSGRRRGGSDVEAAQSRLNGKLNHPHHMVMVQAKEVLVLMPGEEVPTSIALPTPTPCPPHRISWPLPQHNAGPYANSVSS